MIRFGNRRVLRTGKKKRLIKRLREAIRSRHYSRRTEKAYWYWIRYFVFFRGKRHPAEMGAAAMINMHVMNQGARAVKSPLDRLAEPQARYA